MDEQAKKKFLITTAYIVTVGAIVFIVCRFLLKYLMPFILGGLIAWAVQKPAYYISGKTRLNPKISAAALTIAGFAVLAAVLFFAFWGPYQTGGAAPKKRVFFGWGGGVLFFFIWCFV